MRNAKQGNDLKFQTFGVYSRARGKIYFHDFLKGVKCKMFALWLKTGLPQFTYLNFLWHILHVLVLFFRVHSQLVLKQRERSDKKVKLFTTKTRNKT